MDTGVSHTREPSMGDWNLDALLLFRSHLAWLGLLLFIGLEALMPFSKPKAVRWRHYLVNVALAGGNLALLRLVWGGLLLGAAFHASERGIGLFFMLGLSEPWRILLTFLCFDALSYTMHVLYHYLPALWRLHQVHHSDRDFDVTTASRFHFGEILLSTMVQTLIAVGVGVHNKDGKLVPLDVKAGDRVLFSKFGGTDVQLNGKDYLILRESDLLGILS
jgi:sterol desaturase/sphingolipid hydroxylase (fatty acid hydroxylase superfamily)